jgi:hypothetical protein
MYIHCEIHCEIHIHLILGLPALVPPTIFFREKTYFLRFTPVHGNIIMMANGASIPVLGMGTVRFTINGIPVKIIHCYHTPGLRASLY